MTPTADFLNTAEKRIRLLLQEIRPELLKAYGVIEHTLKSDKTLLTKMDLEIEDRLMAVCKELDPGIGFGGEETGVDYNQKTFWLVDPIDGTEPFVRGLPFSTNMITLIDQSQPVMAIIYNFILDEYYLAVKGKGATRNGHPIKASSRPLGQGYITGGGGLRRAGLTDASHRLGVKVGTPVQMNASGFELTALARGGTDAHVNWQGRGKAWDYAPGLLLVQEAGGRVENLVGGYDYRDLNFIAANPLIFNELLQFVKNELPVDTLANRINTH